MEFYAATHGSTLTRGNSGCGLKLIEVAAGRECSPNTLGKILGCELKQDAGRDTEVAADAVSPGRKSRVWVETAATGTSRARATVSPERDPGRGLKHDRRALRPRARASQPGCIPGVG